MRPNVAFSFLVTHPWRKDALTRTHLFDEDYFIYADYINVGMRFNLRGVATLGRFGELEHLNMDGCIRERIDLSKKRDCR